MIIVYVGIDEALVMTPEDENKAVTEYFDEAGTIFLNTNLSCF